jgi:hypothetical protein
MFRIVIPSYNRPNQLKNKTLKTLLEGGISLSSIDIFVSSKEQLELYRNECHPDANYIVGVLGMANIRNFITDYYDEDVELLCIDDDIKKFSRYTNRNTPLQKIERLDEMFENCWREAREKGIELWGIYPVHNGYFMTPYIKTGLFYIIGNFYGIKNKKSIKVSGNDKEDYERSILFYKRNPEKGVMRFEYLSADTRGYTNSGGMNDTVFDRGYDEILRRTKEIYEQYPTLCSMNLTKKSNKPEIRLKPIKISHWLPKDN